MPTTHKTTLKELTLSIFYMLYANTSSFTEPLLEFMCILNSGEYFRLE